MEPGLGSYATAWAIRAEAGKTTALTQALGLVETAAALQLRLVQIADNIALAELTPAEIETLRDRARDLGVRCELGLRGITAENLTRYLDLCERMDAPLLRAVADAPGYEPSPQTLAAVIGAQTGRLERSGMTLAIENHDRFPVKTLAGLIREINHRLVGICLDTVNSFGALEGPEVVLGELLPLTVNVHVKDFRVVREPHQMGFRIQGAPAGAGALDIPGLVSRLKQLGREPNLILELWPPPEETEEATVAKERQWVEQSVAYLKSVLRSS